MKPLANLSRLVLTTVGVAALLAGQPALAQTRTFNISAEPMATAITQLGQQGQVQILADAADMVGLRARPVRGDFEVRSALRAMLAGSGLEIVADDGRTITIGKRAANVPLANEPIAVDELVVTGYRLQSRRSVEAKRQAATISEFISQDDAGQNPDYNIADALRRVPGVSAVFDEDEGRYAAVRGLNPDYSLVTLNGMQLASSDQASRRVLIEQVPASAVSRIQIIKSLTPAMDGNAIGGSIDLQSRSAFDAKGVYLVAQALGGYYDSNDVPGKNRLSYRGDATFSTTFGAEKQFGLVLSGSYFQRTRDQERLIIAGYSYYTPAGVAVADPRDRNDLIGLPNGSNYLNYTLTSKRFGGSGTLEYRPNDQLRASLYYSHYTQDDDETRYGQVVTPVGAPQITSPSTGVVTQARVSASVSQFVISKPIDVAQARVAYDFGRGKLDVRGSFSQAKWDERGPGIAFLTAASAQLGYRYGLDGVPSISFLNPDYLANPGNYPLTTSNSVNFNVRERVKDVQADYTLDLNDSWAITLGGKFKETERLLDREQPTWTSTGLTLADFVRDERSYVPPYATSPMLLPSRTAFWSYFDANQKRFTYNAAASATAGLTADYLFDEKVSAGYLMATHQGPRHNLIFGGRYESTDLEIKRALTQAGVVTPIINKSQYNDFLPSAVFTYDLTDQVKIRAAAGRTLGRANQSDLAGGESRSETGGIVTVSRPNPDLKPRKADSVDLSLEYYFGPGGANGIVSAGVFRKKIKNEIFRGTQDLVDNGITYRITQPQNLEGATLTGLELNVVRNRLDFLPGLLSNLGVSANYTYIDTDAQIVMANGTRRSVSQLLEQPSRLFNASVFYKQGPLETRLSYSRPGKSFQSISTATAVEDVVYKAFNQLDLQVRYDIGEHLKLVAEGRNLLGKSRDTYRPYFGEVREINQHGRGFWIGVSYRY